MVACETYIHVTPEDPAAPHSMDSFGPFTYFPLSHKWEEYKDLHSAVSLPT